jgi:hypothetical protein
MTDKIKSVSIEVMHNNYYASGFLYNSVSEKILLQPSSIESYSHTLFTKKCSGNVQSINIFQQIISEGLGISIPQKFIKQVYEYVIEDCNDKYTIYYADIIRMGDIIKHKDNETDWFNTKQLTKLQLNKQTRHDIMIGQRVIRAEYSS